MTKPRSSRHQPPKRIRDQFGKPPQEASPPNPSSRNSDCPAVRKGKICACDAAGL